MGQIYRMKKTENDLKLQACGEFVLNHKIPIPLTQNVVPVKKHDIKLGYEAY